MTNHNHDYDIELRPTQYRNGKVSRYEVARPEPRPRPRIIGADDDIQHIASPVPTERSRVQYIVAGSPLDEARAFNYRTNNLALIIASGSVLIAVWFGAGLTALTGIMAFGAIYAVCWLIAYLVDVLRSPGGIELFHAWHLWQFLRREQAHRHRRPASDTGYIISQAVLGGFIFVWFVAAFIILAHYWMPR